MKTELHPASERGHENFGWLDTCHSFSFATYFNPAREQFGCLRALNDDTVEGDTGFDLHPHNNMEIVTLVLDGALEHRDSMGNAQVLRAGEIQAMTAGTGIFHAEFNHSETKQLKFLQIWIFPREKGLKPRYDQIVVSDKTLIGELSTLVTPDDRQLEGSLWIHQDAYISTLNLQKQGAYEYQTRIPGNGVFLFLITGETEVEGNNLNSRDAIACHDAATVALRAVHDSKLLIIEVPVNRTA
jgi:hypothetical protein